VTILAVNTQNVKDQVSRGEACSGIQGPVGFEEIYADPGMAEPYWRLLLKMVTREGSAEESHIMAMLCTRSSEAELYRGLILKMATREGSAE
jgi:hypothetical protein